jgi:hypothetical protein
MRIAFRRETAVPMFALTFASIVSVTLVIARIVWTGQLRYAFLVWNLFLAWMPLIFALLAKERYWDGQKKQGGSGGFRNRNGRFAGLTRSVAVVLSKRAIHFSPT